VVEQLGWSSVSCITGGLALSAVSDGHVSIVVGVVIIACVSLMFCFIGLRGVLLYEKYAWILFFVIFMIIYGMAAPHASLAPPVTAVTGVTKSGNALSLVGVVYGSSASWSSIVSDFYVHYPVDTPKIKVFLYTTLGITIPTCIGMILGACVGSALDTNPKWEAAYGVGMGDILKTIMFPEGFAKFILVLLVLSGSMWLNAMSLRNILLTRFVFQSESTVLPSMPAHSPHSSLLHHSRKCRGCSGHSSSLSEFY
jgi:purine-cytosine permease-like protein